MNYIVVITTVETESDALQIAREAVGQRLAACAQVVGPIQSVYRWEGRLETSTEYRCELKTRADRFDAIQTLLRDLHPYELPEIISLPIQASSAPYASWLEEALADV